MRSIQGGSKPDEEEVHFESRSMQNHRLGPCHQIPSTFMILPGSAKCTVLRSLTGEAAKEQAACLKNTLQGVIYCSPLAVALFTRHHGKVCETCLKNFSFSCPWRKSVFSAN